MCYACSPSCDNCFAKLLECPTCGLVQPLEAEECAGCGHGIALSDREEAVARWNAGHRLSALMARQAREARRAR